MGNRSWVKDFAGIAILLAGMCAVLPAQAHRRLWVLTEPDSIVEYDPSTFAPKPAIKVPREALTKPGDFSVNKNGWMLFAPRMGESGEIIWLWNGREAAFFDRGNISARALREESLLVTEILPGIFLSGDSPNLYGFENQFRKLVAAENQIERSVTTTFRAWKSGPSGGDREQIAIFSIAPCECATGVCEETCPQGDAWVPDGGLEDFFIVTVYVPGQLQSEYQVTLIYRKGEGEWSGARLLQPLEQILDATERGNIVLHAVIDGGCCGWDNEGNDKTVLTRNGKDIDLFDERARYGNPNYDVSFFTPEARLSPGAQFAAMTITNTSRPGGEIRLSSGGKEDPAELRRIRRAMAELPAVEVLLLNGSPVRSAFVPRATLAGWLNADELLVVQDDLLVAVSASTGIRRASPIRVPDAARVFIR